MFTLLLIVISQHTNQTNCPKRALSYTLEATTKKTIKFKQRVNKIFLVTHLDFRLQSFILLTKGATLDFFLSAAVNLKLENVSWSLPPGSPKTTARDRKETSCFGTPQRKIHTTSESKFHFTISGSGNFVHCKKQNFFLSLKSLFIYLFSRDVILFTRFGLKCYATANKSSILKMSMFTKSKQGREIMGQTGINCTEAVKEGH